MTRHSARARRLTLPAASASASDTDLLSIFPDSQLYARKSGLMIGAAGFLTDFASHYQRHFTRTGRAHAEWEDISMPGRDGGAISFRKRNIWSLR